MKNPFSIRSGLGIRKRIFFLLLIFFVPLLLLESFVYFKWFQVQKEAEMQANLELARSVAKNFETFLQGLIRSELSIGLAFTASRPMTDQDRDHMLDAFQADNPAVRSIFWMNSDGTVVASSLRAYIGFHLNDRSFFQSVKEGRDWAISELIVGRATGKAGFTVSRGIRNESGELLGVVAASVEPDRMESVLGVVRSKEAGVSLLDNKGMHVCRYPPSTYTWEQRDWLNLYPVIGEVLKGKEVVTTQESKIRGADRIVAFTPVSSIGWVTAASRAESEVVEGIFETLLPQALLILLVTLAAFGAAMTLSRPISTSIRRLQDHAAALGRREVARLETIPGPREIMNLAEAFNDMAEKVRLREEALRKSEKENRELLETANSIIIRWDKEGIIRFINDYGLRFFGYSAEELLGRDIKTIVPKVESTGRDLDELDKDILKNPEKYMNVTNENIRKDGKTVWVSWTNKAILDEHGNVREILAIGNDITALKKAEALLWESRAKLEESNKALEGFAYTISHDLRAPLRAINGYARMVVDDYGPALEEEGKRKLAAIETNAIKMGQLIDDLLAFSRASQGAMNVSGIDLNSLVADVAAILKTPIAGVKPDIDVGSLPAAQGDPALIRQVLANLLENAIKFSRNRTDARIEVGSFERDGEQVYFVKDNGVGFDMKYSNKLFGVFQRLVTDREFEGTGVGLAIVHRLVARHGGRVWAEAKPGEGATFFFTLKQTDRVPA